MTTRIGDCEIRRCPQAWHQLLGEQDAAVKFCAVCWKDVHLATTPAQVREFAARGLCVAYRNQDEKIMGSARLPPYPPEHRDPELFDAVSRHRAGTSSLEDLRFIASRFLKYHEREDAIRFLILFLDAGGQPDVKLITEANKFGIDATNPAPSAL